jgi:hypothetical protein
MQMMSKGETGSIVTLLRDCGERHRSPLYDDAWLSAGAATLI